ncbi:chlorophyllide a oxygenase, chloroplastic [Solanum lycopersicum]|uniref:Uncharacterized protein n=1 Tax=Solanum lycopersicum TaxID=4081 RepID=A0A3Q7FLW9_SOLLC
MEYSTIGKCETMPSTRLLNVKIKALLCFEQERMIWICHLQLLFLFYNDLLDFKMLQSLINFLTPASGVQKILGSVYIDMVLRPTCMVYPPLTSQSQANWKLEGQSTKQCSTSSNECLTTFIMTEDTVNISNVTGFFSPAETHPLDAICSRHLLSRIAYSKAPIFGTCQSLTISCVLRL